MHKLSLDDIIEWDILNWAELIPTWSAVIESLPQDSKVLAIGERNGGMSTWLALNGFHVLCTDRDYPSQKAREIHERHGLADKITYGKFDVVHTDSTFFNSFDLIIAKSVIGGVKETYHDAGSRNLAIQQQAIDNIYACLKPGGIFLGAENMAGSYLLQKLRQLQGRQKGWRYLTLSEVQQLLKPFSSTDIKLFGLLPGMTNSRLINKIIYLLNKYSFSVFPPSYKYISFLTARKH